MMNKLNATKDACFNKATYLFAFGLYFSILFLNEVYFKIENLFKKPNTKSSFFSPLEHDSNESNADKNIHWERA